MRISLPQNRWFGDGCVDIDVPPSWDVHVAEMQGDLLPALDRWGIRDKIDTPYGAPAIKELAKAKSSACIIFDDMSRGTPCNEISHIILDELLEAGIPKEKIVFICALGNHGALELDDFTKKLGADIVAEYPVYNHNPYENCVYVGTTSRGIRTMINAEVLKYDLKIAIGAIVPHPIAGFGGGSKIIMPGVSSIETVAANHKKCMDSVWKDNDRPFIDMVGNLQNVDMREDAEEIAMLAGLDFKIDVLLNSRNQIIDIYAGHPIVEYYEGVKKAFEVYKTERFDPVDVCIVNANSKSNEAFIAATMCANCVKDDGDLILINFCPTGIVNHYLTGMWGLDTGGRMSSGNNHLRGFSWNIRRMIIFSPYQQHIYTIFYGKTSQVLWANSWDKVLDMVGDRGKGTTAAVWTEGLLEMFDAPFKREYVPKNINLRKSTASKTQS